jgi:hypothetical protein
MTTTDRETVEAQVGSLTDPEWAAFVAVSEIADTTSGLGVSKWDLVQSRLRVAAARAEQGPEVWEEVVPHLRGLGDGVIVTRDRGARILEALAVPGVLGELRDHLEVAVLRIRVTRRKPTPDTNTTTEETSF